MEKYVVVNAEGKFVANSSNSLELSFTDDINQACLHDDDDIACEEGYRIMRVNVIITVIPVPECELEIVEHTTSRNKTIKGVIRKDLTSAQAKAIDPYTFQKDGGYFIREKYLK